jgi:hypothetical protein
MIIDEFNSSIPSPSTRHVDINKNHTHNSYLHIQKHFIRQAACQPTHGASVSSEAGGNEQRKKKRNKKEETK